MCCYVLAEGGQDVPSTQSALEAVNSGWYFRQHLRFSSTSLGIVADYYRGDRCSPLVREKDVKSLIEIKCNSIPSALITIYLILVLHHLLKLIHYVKRKLGMVNWYADARDKLALEQMSMTFLAVKGRIIFNSNGNLWKGRKYLVKNATFMWLLHQMSFSWILHHFTLESSPWDGPRLI